MFNGSQWVVHYFVLFCTDNMDVKVLKAIQKKKLTYVHLVYLVHLVTKYTWHPYH